MHFSKLLKQNTSEQITNKNMNANAIILTLPSLYVNNKKIDRMVTWNKGGEMLNFFGKNSKS